MLITAVRVEGRGGDRAALSASRKACPLQGGGTQKRVEERKKDKKLSEQAKLTKLEGDYKLDANQAAHKR